MTVQNYGCLDLTILTDLPLHAISHFLARGRGMNEGIGVRNHWFLLYIWGKGKHS